MVLDTDNLPFSADMLHRFSADSCAAIRWRPRGNARIVRGSVQSSADERGRIRTWLKMGIDCWILSVMLPLRLYPMVSHFVTRIHTTFSILTYIFEAVTKLAQLHKRLHDTWLSPFSARIRAEFLSRFFRAVSCGKSERVRTDIRVRPHWKFEEFFRKM